MTDAPLAAPRIERAEELWINPIRPASAILVSRAEVTALVFKDQSLLTLIQPEARSTSPCLSTS